MSEAVILQRIDQLTTAVQSLTTMMGARLSRAQLADRIGVHRNTLSRYMTKPGFPLPGRDGKWLLSEVIEWERGR